MRSKLVYICSPYRGDIEKNVRNAQSYSFKAITQHPDVIPIAPHLLFTQYLDDEDPEQRRIGLSMGLDLLALCDELWVYGLGNPSEGMAAEIALAKELSIQIRDGFNPGAYIPDEDLAAYGQVTITVPGSTVYADDIGILAASGPQQLRLEAEAVFGMAKQLRLFPGKNIDYTVAFSDEEVQP